MTEFERQVEQQLEPGLSERLLAVVLAATKLGGARDAEAIETYRAQQGAACDALRDWLVPCVAAAIREAAAWPVTFEETDGGMRDATSAALVALRGAA